MRISKLIARVEDAAICAAHRAQRFAAEFRHDLTEARARRMARQIESQAVVAARAFEIVAERNVRIIE